MAEVIDRNTIVSPKEIAAVLKITSRHVRRLTEDDVLHKVNGGYNLADAVEDYYSMKYQRPMDPDERKLDLEMKKANVELKQNKATITKMEAEELQGKMHRAEDVEAVTGDMVFTIRSALAALPGRLSMNLVNIGTAAEASQIIRKEVTMVMNELADYEYNPKRYQEIVRERKAWDQLDPDEDEE